MSRIHDVLLCDAYRLLGPDDYWPVTRAAIRHRTFRPILTLRWIAGLRQSRSAGARLLMPLARLLHRWFCAGAGMDLSHSASIGPGLCITHGWGLVVSPGARIGANCTLFHGVTLGQKDTIAADGSRSTGFPTLEFECWVGPGAVVIGDVCIGRGSIVGPSAVVLQSVPASSVVVGNPARTVGAVVVPDVYNRVPDDLLIGSA